MEGYVIHAPVDISFETVPDQLMEQLEGRSDTGLRKRPNVGEHTDVSMYCPNLSAKEPEVAAERTGNTSPLAYYSNFTNLEGANTVQTGMEEIVLQAPVATTSKEAEKELIGTSERVERMQQSDEMVEWISECFEKEEIPPVLQGLGEVMKKVANYLNANNQSGSECGQKMQESLVKETGIIIGSLLRMQSIFPNWAQQINGSSSIIQHNADFVANTEAAITDAPPSTEEVSGYANQQADVMTQGAQNTEGPSINSQQNVGVFDTAIPPPTQEISVEESQPGELMLMAQDGKLYHFVTSTNGGINSGNTLPAGPQTPHTLQCANDDPKDVYLFAMQRFASEPLPPEMEAVVVDLLKETFNKMNSFDKKNSSKDLEGGRFLFREVLTEKEKAERYISDVNGQKLIPLAKSEFITSAIYYLETKVKHVNDITLEKLNEADAERCAEVENRKKQDKKNSAPECLSTFRQKVFVEYASRFRTTGKKRKQTNNGGATKPKKTRDTQEDST